MLNVKRLKKYVYFKAQEVIGICVYLIYLNIFDRKPLKVIIKQ